MLVGGGVFPLAPFLEPCSSLQILSSASGLFFLNVDLCFIYKSQLFWITMCLQGYTDNVEGKIETYTWQKMSYSNKFFLASSKLFSKSFFMYVYTYVLLKIFLKYSFPLEFIIGLVFKLEDNCFPVLC